MDDCIEWHMAMLKSGYGQTRHNGKCERAHRVAYAKARGIPIEELKGLVVRHRCDNPSCVNPEHLEIGTQADNMRDRSERNVRSRRATSSMTKLRASDIPMIRSRLRSGDGITSIGRSFGVDHATIRDIKNGRTWTHIPDD